MESRIYNKSKDGAKLRSIIDRLSGQNALKVSINKDQTSSCRVLLSESNKTVCGTNTLQTSSSRKRKGNAMKIQRFDTAANVKHSFEDCGIRSRQETLVIFEDRVQSDKMLSQEPCKVVYAEPKNVGCPSDFRSSCSSLPTRIKLTLKAGVSPFDTRSELCLCKPYTASKSEIRDENKEAAFSTEFSINDLTDETVEKLPNVCQRQEYSSSDRKTEEGVENIPGFFPESDSQRIFTCGICLKRFPNTFFLEEHGKRTGHYLCSECGESFAKSSLLEAHVSNKQCKKFSCAICRRKFVSEQELFDHHVDDHFMCPKCKRCFKNAENLASHRECCHGDGKLITCGHCGKTFSSPSRYKTHEMALHTGERPFVCPECGKGFSRMYALKTHVTYTHSDEKKFKCEFCEKKFKRKDHMKSHQVIHASKKPYCCEHCGKGFNQRVLLKRHLPCRNPRKKADTRDVGVETTQNDAVVSENVTVENSQNLTNYENLRSSEKFTNTERTCGNNVPPSQSDTMVAETKVVESNRRIRVEEQNSRKRSGGISEIRENSEKISNALLPDRNDTKTNGGYFGCRCPAQCACKKFTISVEVTSGGLKGLQNDFDEVATMPCCCDVHPGEL